MRIQFAIVVVALLGASLPAQTSAPERTVHGNTIDSARDPQVRIELPRNVHYLGADRWVLYSIADCELHAFVVADKNKNVQQLFWVQFEQYLPTRPDLHHTYDSPRHTQIGGLDFFVDTWVRRNDAKIDPGSDREHIEKIIRDKGYKMPPGMMYVRLVHLLDEQKRKELMIIYGEDLAPTGFTAAELAEGGTSHASWPQIDKGLIERSKEKISIQHR